MVFPTYSISLPWDQHTPTAYIIEMFFNLFSLQIYTLISGVIMFLFISLCLYHRAFYQMFRQSAGELKTSDRKSYHKKYIFKLLQLHITTKKYVSHFFDNFHAKVIFEYEQPRLFDMNFK